MINLFTLHAQRQMRDLILYQILRFKGDERSENEIVLKKLFFRVPCKLSLSIMENHSYNLN